MILLGLAGLVAGLPGCGSAPGAVLTADGRIRVVAAESQYGDVAAQVGGRYVDVTSIETNPNTDPHSYELSPSVAAAIQSAGLVIQNGLGYDPFMNRIESATSVPGRRILDVQDLLRLPDSTPNPHLWYAPATMPAVAAAIASDLAAVQAGHGAYFRANAARFVSSLRPWNRALARIRADHPGAPVAATEPVGDYLLRAAGLSDRTPFSFESAVMNGVDPAPQDLTTQGDLIRRHRVDVLVYNAQVTDPMTAGFVRQARKAGIPVVALYETMPVPGYHYQTWMLAETEAIQRALTSGASTERL
jgi:zinc/manganese transport system substrate-binding protein